MKTLYKTLAMLITALLLMQTATAKNPKKKLRRFLPKKAVPGRIEIVIGGHGNLAHRYGKKDHFNPYGNFQIGMKVYTQDNKVYGTPGVGGGIFSWKNFDVEVIGGTFSHSILNRSNVEIQSPDEVPGHRIRLRVSSKLLPGVVKEFEIPLDFSYSYRLNSKGQIGATGPEDCRPAPSGPQGRDHEKCDGEDGRDGRRGKPGGFGFDGAPGPNIEVQLYPYTDLNSNDLVIEAHELNLRTGRLRKRWFKPGTANLTVISRGGRGGSGGDGQVGGCGGSGGDGGRLETEKREAVLAFGGHGGDGGRGGRGGDGGIGGNGGQITIIFHPDLMPHLGSITAISLGGEGGCAGDGGKGGRGGSGGEGTKADGQNGRKGGCAPDGLRGPRGFDGPAVQWVPMNLNS